MTSPDWMKDKFWDIILTKQLCFQIPISEKNMAKLLINNEERIQRSDKVIKSIKQEQDKYLFFGSNE